MLILHIDDDLDDCEIFKELLKSVDESIECIHARNGYEGIAFLERGRLPNCIFLDINMPHLNGKETLLKLKADKRFQQIPIVMYTTSSRELDRSLYTGLGANGYIVKASDFTTATSDISKILKSEKLALK